MRWLFWKSRPAPQPSTDAKRDLRDAIDRIVAAAWSAGAHPIDIAEALEDAATRQRFVDGMSRPL